MGISYSIIRSKTKKKYFTMQLFTQNTKEITRYSDSKIRNTKMMCIELGFSSINASAVN
ncbi:hypothetical protein HanIR_Chr01g0050021 [Helianthus annuus]|nr:hypothetical protein HanIR_Chr01g0050021 [Helianthus annuus]